MCAAEVGQVNLHKSVVRFVARRAVDSLGCFFPVWKHRIVLLSCTVMGEVISTLKQHERHTQPLAE